MSLTTSNRAAPDQVALDRMADRLTVPFERGAARFPLTLLPPRGGGAADGGLVVAEYESLLAEHRARFDTVPDPRYVLTVLEPLPAPVMLTIGYSVNAVGEASPRAATMSVPTTVHPGMSVPLSLGVDDGPAARLRTLTANPPVPATSWRVDALLGTMAKLLWVNGVDRDELHAQLDQVHLQTRLADAVGLALDLLGHDLGVPRFPPLPYAVDDHTVALYHLDDEPGAAVTDATGLHRPRPHPGTVAGARAGVPGRFGRGIAFDVSADATAEITVADHADLNTPATASLTVECFAKPVAGAWEGTVLAKRDQADPGAAGWALSIGTFGRGIDRNVRFRIGDGGTAVEVFADASLPITRFSHLAGVLDRAAGQVRLFVNGVPVAASPIGGLGRVSNTVALRIGTGMQGVLDEVRVSRSARTAFHPVLGESDADYRRRLRIFQRWTLATPAGLQAALDDVVDPIAGVTSPFVVDDTDSVTHSATAMVRVVPVELGPAETIDDLGRRGVTEAEVCGEVAADTGFDAALLVVVSDPRIAGGTAPMPSGSGSHPRRMRLGTRRALLRLLTLIDEGMLTIDAGYDPAASGLRAVGRATRFTHDALADAELAALAHRVGFDFVEHRAAGGVYAAVRSVETIEILLDAPSEPVVGQSFDVRVEQVDGAEYGWRAIGFGTGRALLTGATDQPRCTMQADGPGEVVVEVTLRLAERSHRATRTVLVGLVELPPGQSIGAVDPGEPVESSYLVTVREPALDSWFADGLEVRRMQPGLLARLRALRTLVGDTGVPRIATGWQADGTGPERAGRALAMTAGTVTGGLPRLGGLAQRAGFDLVENDGERLRMVVAGGDVVGFAVPDTMPEGGAITLDAVPRAQPNAVAVVGQTVWTANTGTDTVTLVDTGSGQVDRVLKVPVERPRALVQGGGRLFVEGVGGPVAVYDAGAGNLIQVVDDTRLAGSSGTLSRTLAHHRSARLYAVRIDPCRIVEIDTGSGTVTRTVDLAPADAAGVAIAADPDGDRLWAVTVGEATAQIVDTDRMTVAATVQLPAPAVDVVVGNRRAYVATGETVLILDAGSGAVQSTVAGLGSPARLALTPDGAQLLVTVHSGGGSALHRRGPDGASLGAPIDLGESDCVVAAAGAEQAYVLRLVDAGADRVTVLDLGTGSRAAEFTIGTGNGERLTWSVHPSGAAGGVLSSTTAPSVQLQANTAGPLRIRLTYTGPQHSPPYTVAIGLHPELIAKLAEGVPVVVPKHTYDLVMNVLNHLCPMGVEIDTRQLRTHVLELGANPLEVFPGYTYPDFRSRGRPPTRTARDLDRRLSWQ